MQRSFKISLSQEYYSEKVCLSQYDSDYAVNFEVLDKGAKAPINGMTAYFEGTRCDGLSFRYTGTASDNFISFTIDTALTAVSGRHTGEIVLYDGSGLWFGSANVQILVEKAARPDNAIDADVEEARSIAEQIQEIVDTAAETTAASTRQIVGDLTDELSTVKEDLINQLDPNYMVELVKGERANVSGPLMPFRIHAGDSVTVSSKDGSTFSNVQFRYYDADKKYVDYWGLYTAHGNSRTFTVSKDAWYVGITTINIDSPGIYVAVNNSSTYRQNISEEANGVREEVNSLCENIGFIKPVISGWIDGKYIAKTDGLEQSNSTYHATDFIAINPKLGNIIITSSNVGNYDRGYNAWYDSNKNFISPFSYGDNQEKTLTPPTNAKYMRISSNKTVVLTVTTPYADKTLVDMLPEITETGNYVITSALRKENLIVEKLVGTLTYSQSFCMFDGKYYSTNGTNISEQDTSFTELRNAVVNVGHGNALQLGHNGKAYASGWNDNKVYIVDLATLTVENTITLPTTGYITCAIDDLNSIAYIFQRDSYPDNEAPYTFIAYDYLNGQTLYSRKTAPFAAMQACDLFNDTIIVVNGLGTTVAPNYCKVYDINGVVTGQYILPDIMRTGEPEGVFFDRNTCDIYVSKESRDIYKISH